MEEVRQTPFSALLPLCGIRHLSPGLSFPSGKTGAPKNKWGEEPGLWVQVTAWSSVEEGPAQASSQNSAGFEGTDFSKDGCGGASMKA